MKVDKDIMQMKNQTLILIALLVFLASSCRKDVSFDVPVMDYKDTGWAGSINPEMDVFKLISDLKLPFKDTIYHINSFNTPVALSLQQDQSRMSIEIHDGFLQDQNRTPAVGDINIVWTIAEKKWELIQNLAVAESVGIKDINGAFFIRFMKGGLPLTLSQGAYLEIHYTPQSMPANQTSALNLYNGTYGASGDHINWNLGGAGNSVTRDNTHFEINTVTTGWFMITHSENSSSGTYTVRPSLPSSLYTDKNTSAYLLTDKAVYQLKADTARREFSMNGLYPNLINPKVLILSRMGDSYYYGIENLTTQGSSYIGAISTQKVSLDQLKYLLNGL